MKHKWCKMYMDMAIRAAEESYAYRLKVGAIFVSEDGVMSMGINGHPSGYTNVCEDKIYAKDEAVAKFDKDSYPFYDSNGHYRLVTKQTVSHAEENLIGKMLRQGVSTKNGSIFITHAPCIGCAKIIVVAGIKNVYYRNSYRSDDGLLWLKENNVEVNNV